VNQVSSDYISCVLWTLHNSDVVLTQHNKHILKTLHYIFQQEY
jgi:hypothetical protein